MPVKIQNHHTKSYPKHFAKVYWPYLPLAIIVAAGLWLGRPAADNSSNSLVHQKSQISAATLLAQTNQARVQNGVSALTINQQLSKAATQQATDMVANNYWSKDGQSKWQFIKQSGYNYQKVAENLAYGFNSSSQAVSGWLSNSSHRANLLDTSYHQVGFGVASSQNYLGKGPETVIVTIYGAPAGSDITNTNLTTNQATAAGVSDAAPLLSSATTSVSKAQILTGGNLPWIGAALAVLGVGSLLYLGIKHSVAWRRRLRRGQRYTLTHPVFDLTIVAVAALCALLCQSVGFIR